MFVLDFLVLFSICFFSGMVVAKNLHPNFDAKAMFLLAPASGLMSIFLLNAVLFTIGLWSFELVTFFVFLLIIFSLISMRIELRMFKAAVWEKSIKTRLESLRNTSNLLFFLVIFSFALVALLPLLIFKIPMGVDWIGFSSLSQSLNQHGSFQFPHPNQGSWLYPPSFVATAAWYQSLIQLTSVQANFLLGQTSLLFLLLAFLALCDYHKFGLEGSICIILSAGLFAKTFDSGWPTVASQIGIIMALFLIPNKNQYPIWKQVLIFSILGFAIFSIHPSGGISYLLLCFASLNFREITKWSRRQIIQVTSLSLIIFLVLNFILWHYGVSSEINAEYGWQGGIALLLYNGILVAIALVAIFQLRTGFVFSNILIKWFLMLWLLSFIQFFEGWKILPLFSVISLSLYSMGIHAFHVPLALLSGFWLYETTRKNTTKVPGEQVEGAKESIFWQKRGKIVFAIIACSLLIASQVAMITMIDHDEMMAQTKGDLRIYELVNELEDGVLVYNENVHWGYSTQLSDNIGMTSFPNLGILNGDNSLQNAATSAITSNNVSRISSLGITHAISSPKGTVGWHLSKSPNWEILADYDGSRLWEFKPNSETSNVSTYIKIEAHDCDCDKVVDPWNEFRFSDPFNLGDERVELHNGELSINTSIEEALVGQMVSVCVVSETIGKGLISIDSMFMESHAQGWQQWCWEAVLEDHLSFNLSFAPMTSSWLNPWYFSGRSSEFVDETSTRLHWVELRTDVEN